MKNKGDIFTMKFASFQGHLVIVGFGSIGPGVLPLILRHIDLDPAKITIVTAEDRGHSIADEYGIRFIREPLTRENYRRVLEPMLSAGDFLLNVSVDVSSLALIKFCRDRDILYLDTCIEPWIGGYTDISLSPSLRSNYAYREEALKLRRPEGSATAVITHGANPGMVSHFLKQALLNLARDSGLSLPKPQSRVEWAKLMQRLSVKVVHVAERDTQVPEFPKRVGEFVNTWSIEGFVGEGCQPAELGWGSHERTLPAGGRHHDFGCGAAIYLNRPGASTKVRTWTPTEGPFHGFLITHGEAISIGQVAAAKLSHQVLGLPSGDVARIEKLFTRAGLPVKLKLDGVRRKKLFAAMKLDKKVSGGEVKFVLAKKIGRVKFGCQVPLETIREIIEACGR